LGLTLVTIEFSLFKKGSRVEVENRNGGLICASEQMSTIRELNVLTLFDVEFLVVFQLILEDIEHSNLVTESDNDVESRRMEGN